MHNNIVTSRMRQRRTKSKFDCPIVGIGRQIQEQLAYFAKAKCKFKRDEARWQCSFNGCKGEYAAATCLGVKMNMEIHRGGDKGYDIVLIDQTTAAVKYRHNKGRGLAFSKEEEFSPNAKVAILTTGECDKLAKMPCPCCEISSYCRVLVPGWISREEFMDIRQRGYDLGCGWRMWVDQHQLRPMWELEGIVKEAKWRVL